jgi:hypothetical protein
MLWLDAIFLSNNHYAERETDTHRFRVWKDGKDYKVDKATLQTEDCKAHDFFCFKDWQLAKGM